jgi:hypothetical protein
LGRSGATEESRGIVDPGV